MNTPATPVPAPSETLGSRVRALAIAGGFALVLLIPKILNIRKDERSWTAFRVLLACAGAGLVILPLSLWNSWLAAIAGLLIFLLAILLPPAAPAFDLDAKARELGALVVVNGGQFRPRNALPISINFFVGAENVWALDSQLRTVLVIPVAGVSALQVRSSSEGWSLQITWMDYLGEFSYRGIFAEHLATVAETTIRGILRPAQPVLPRARAAGA